MYIRATKSEFVMLLPLSRNLISYSLVTAVKAFILQLKWDPLPLLFSCISPYIPICLCPG